MKIKIILNIALGGSLLLLLSNSYAQQDMTAPLTTEPMLAPAALEMTCEFQVLNVQPYQSVLICAPNINKQLNPIAAEPRLTNSNKDKS